MSIRKLRWISVIAPTVFVGVFEIVTRSLLGNLVPLWVHVVVALAAVSVAAFAFSTFVFASMRDLEREIHVRNRRLAALNALASDVSESLDVEQVATATTRSVLASMSAEAAGLALVSEQDGSLQLVGQDGLSAHIPPGNGGLPLGENDCECRKAVTLGRPVVVEDTSQSLPCIGLLGERTNTCVAVPVKSKGRTTGAIFVARDKDRPWQREDVDLIAAVGSQVGTVLENAQLFSKTEALAVLEERERVSREVHDGLAQTLGYLNVQLGILDRLLASDEPDKARAEVNAMSLVTRDAYQDLRQVIADLRTPLSSPSGLRRTLREYAENFSRQTGIPCHFEGHRGPPAVLSPTTEVQLIRIVQEAMTNIKKHAPESQAWLSVEVRNGEALVVIRDNGSGFDLDSTIVTGRQYGLQTMKERAESVGGSLRLESGPGDGTVVEVMVPLENGRPA
jgi:signal transduction histidine kinase